MQLHAYMRTAGGLLLLASSLLACASRFWLSVLEVMGATQVLSRTHGSACGHISEGGAVLRCEKWRAPEAEPRAPSKSKQRRAARL
jgi:hypothetical protein